MFERLEDSGEVHNTGLKCNASEYGYKGDRTILIAVFLVLSDPTRIRVNSRWLIRWIVRC